MAIPQSSEARDSPSLSVTPGQRPLFQCVTAFFNWILLVLLLPVSWLKQAAKMFVHIASKAQSKLSKLSWSVILLISAWVVLGICHICWEMCLLAPVFHKINLLASGGSNDGIVFGVLSSRDHFMQRHAVRSTWALDLQVSSGYLPSKIVFVVGQEDCHIHPKLRIPYHTCQSAMTQGTLASKWHSTSLQFSTDLAEKVDILVTGLSFVTLVDVFIASLLVHHSCGVTVQVDGEKHKFFELIEKKNAGQSYYEVKIGKIVPAKKVVKISVCVEHEHPAFVTSPGEQCMWSNGSSSVYYDYIRLRDGSSQPWSDGLCVPFSVVFENGKSQCPPNWRLFNGHCYLIPKERNSWYSAVDHCKSFDAVLASISNEAENSFLTDLLSGIPVWIGAIANASSQIHEWVDGSDFLYTNWDDYEPNNRLGIERCIELSARDGRWNDYDCSSPMNFVCKKSRVSEADLTPELSLEAKQQLQQQWQDKQETIREKLESEQRLYGDMLIVPGLIDSPHNLPQKLFALLKWMSSTYPGSWLFKVDDSTLVNVRLAMNLLKDMDSKPQFLQDCGVVVSHFEKLLPLSPNATGEEHPFRGDVSPLLPHKSGYLLSDKVVSGLAAVAPQLGTQYSETVSLALWLSTLAFSCTASPDTYWDVALAEILYIYHSAIAGLSGILEELFLAKVPISEAAHMDSTAALLRPSPFTAAPATVISYPCWHRKQHSQCEDNFVIASDLSLDEIDKLYKAFLR